MGQKHKNEREKTDWGVLYFSGTGNTRYCVSLLSDSLGRKEIPCPIEKKEAVEVLRSHEALILAYPIQYSNLPDIVRVFIEQNRECWRGKQVFLMATMGLFSGDGTGGSKENIKGEFSNNGVDNDISHTRGTISMARASDPDSASSQFFIVQADSTFLDGDYAGFGHVTEGMDIVDKICEDAKPTDDNGTIPSDQQPVIEKITITD